MCLSIPGKLVQIGENKFIIDYGSEKREAIMSVISDLKVGDYVIVSNKIIITSVPEEQAIKYLELIKFNDTGKKNGKKL